MDQLQQTDVVVDGPAVVVLVEDNCLDSDVLLVSIMRVQFVVSNSYSQLVCRLSGISTVMLQLPIK